MGDENDMDMDGEVEQDDYEEDQREFGDAEERNDEDDQDYMVEEDTNNFTAINQLLQDEQISGIGEDEPNTDQRSSSNHQIDITAQLEQENHYLNEKQIIKSNPIKRNQDSFQKENAYLNG